MDDSTSAATAPFETHTTEESPRARAKTRPVRIGHHGTVLYFGRLPEAEARALEDEKRAELRRTGRVTGARTVCAIPGAAARTGDAVIALADRRAARRPVMRERELMAALLDDAKRVLARGTSTPSERLEAERWFASSDRSYVFSFLTICDELDLDANAIRREQRS